MKDSTRSKHADISFTAHYTGQQWQKLGLSHDALATNTGKMLHRVVAPINWLAHKYFGKSLPETLTIRHQLIDQRIHNYLKRHPTTQVIELAAGLSPRGWRFLQQYQDITYIEVDLPNMVATKQVCYDHIEALTPTLYAADLFTDQLDRVFEQLNTEHPILIVCEGLINYFSLEMLGQLTERIAGYLHSFKHGVWITENYPLSTNKPYAWLIKQSSTTLRMLTNSQYSFYFLTPTEAQHFFCQHGMADVKVYQPSAPQAGHQPYHDAHLGDTVWVFEMSVVTED